MENSSPLRQYSLFQVAHLFSPLFSNDFAVLVFLLWSPARPFSKELSKEGTPFFFPPAHLLVCHPSPPLPSVSSSYIFSHSASHSEAQPLPFSFLYFTFSLLFPKHRSFLFLFSTVSFFHSPLFSPSNIVAIIFFMQEGERQSSSPFLAGAESRQFLGSLPRQFIGFFPPFLSLPPAGKANL